MALWHIPGQGLIDDAQEGIQIPEPGALTLPSGAVLRWGVEGTQKVPEYRNTLQFGRDAFQWDPARRAWQGAMPETAPGYVTGLLDFRDRVRAGTAQPWEVEQYQQYEQQARAIPTRDIGSLTAGWQGEYSGEQANQDWWTSLDPGSPDVGPIMLGLRDKLDAGTASPQERALYDQVYGMAGDWDYRASVPQESDRFNPLGDQFFGALGILGLGATGGLAAAPLVAGGAGLATTLGSLGTLAGVAGTGAGVLGQALDQPWLRNLGLGLGIAGGLAGGIGGLTNVLGGGVSSLRDAARLASAAGKVTGALGRIPGAGPLQQASRYLGLAGGLGQAGSGVQGLLGAAQGVTQGATQGATPAAQDLVTQRGGGGGMDWNDWGGGDFPGDYSASVYAGASPTFNEAAGGAWDLSGYGTPNNGTPYSMNISDYTTPAGNWYQDTGQYIGGSDPAGGGGFLNTILGALGSVGGVLGTNAGLLGPLVSGAGSLLGGRLGAGASSDAAGLQAAALNRGLDLQTAQWLQQQANQAPWLQAGQQALPQLQQLAGQGPQAPFEPGAAIDPRAYGMPSAVPQWTPQGYRGPQAVNAADYRYTPGGVPQAGQYGYRGPQAVQAGDYRWTPGQGPRAADYRYTPGQTPDAAQYRYTPGAVPTLSGQELLANDPGVAFRLQEGRNALEASAAARGGALSGPALAALQRQGQELSSQEYGNAWQRAAQQAQMREGWQQQATAQNFGQAMSAAQLREQLQHVATQQGWSQAQTEAAFREQMAQQASSQGFQQAAAAQGQQWQQGMAGQQFDWQRAMGETGLREQLQQQASQQGFGQALAGQQAQFGQGLQAQQWLQQQQQKASDDYYNRVMGQMQWTVGQDQAANQTNYERQLAAYNSMLQSQGTQWNRLAGLAGYGTQAVGQLGTQGQAASTQMGSLLSQLGTAQGVGAAGEGLAWTRALGGATNNLTSLLASLNR